MKIIVVAALLGASLVLAGAVGAAGAAYAAVAAATTPPAPADTLDASVFAGKPPLWARAIRIFYENEDYVPGKISEKIVQLDKDGRATSTKLLELVLSLDKDGGIATDVAKATKDGKDVTAHERAKIAGYVKKAELADAQWEASPRARGKKIHGGGMRAVERAENHGLTTLGEGPLDAKIQVDVRVKETGVRETVEGRACRRFDFTYPQMKPEPNPGLVIGSIWLEESTGNPVKLELTEDPLPLGIRSLKTTIIYGPEGATWVGKSMRYDAHVGILLMMRQHLRGEAVFTDYWKHKEPEDVR